VPPIINRTTGAVNRAAGAAIRQVQQTAQQVQQLAQTDSVGRPLQADAFERDPAGAPVVRSEVLSLSPTDESLAAARRLNFQVLRQENLGALNLGITVLRAPPGLSVTDALAALRNTDPNGVYDFNHVYNPSGDASATTASALGSASGSVEVSKAAPTMGLVDGGIDTAHPDLKHANIIAANFAGTNKSIATEHGTAIASLLAGKGRINGVVPNATLYAADVFGGSPSGGSADAVAQGLAWLAEKKVPVINISLAGPPNRLVEMAVRAMIARGHVVVAAVGNSGPSTPVQYPAAYEGVIAVTAVDGQRHVQIDANQGPQVMFAAVGVDVSVDALKNGIARVTGTSFAAPLVAARFALLMPAPAPDAAARALLQLETEALDLGVPGRDPVFGYGFLEWRPEITGVSFSAR
jgi:hypothetical protein